MATRGWTGRTQSVPLGGATTVPHYRPQPATSGMSTQQPYYMIDRATGVVRGGYPLTGGTSLAPQSRMAPTSQTTFAPQTMMRAMPSRAPAARVATTASVHRGAALGGASGAAGGTGTPLRRRASIKKSRDGSAALAQTAEEINELDRLEQVELSEFERGKAIERQGQEMQASAIAELGATDRAQEAQLAQLKEQVEARIVAEQYDNYAPEGQVVPVPYTPAPYVPAPYTPAPYTPAPYTPAPAPYQPGELPQPVVVPPGMPGEGGAGVYVPGEIMYGPGGVEAELVVPTPAGMPVLIEPGASDMSGASTMAPLVPAPASTDAGTTFGEGLVGALQSVVSTSPEHHAQKGAFHTVMETGKDMLHLTRKPLFHLMTFLREVPPWPLLCMIPIIVAALIGHAKDAELTHLLYERPGTEYPYIALPGAILRWGWLMSTCASAIAMMYMVHRMSCDKSQTELRKIYMNKLLPHKTRIEASKKQFENGRRIYKVMDALFWWLLQYIVGMIHMHMYATSVMDAMPYMSLGYLACVYRCFSVFVHESQVASKWMRAVLWWNLYHAAVLYFTLDTDSPMV